MMRYKLVIAEKPSVAQSLAAVIGATARKDGYLDGNGWRVSWCVGHLAGLADADSYDPKYAKWRYDDLPILPEHWQMVVGKDKKKQFDILKKLMNAPDVTEVVNACDAGREGELIFRSVYELAGCQKPMKRLWISSMEDSAMQMILPITCSVRWKLLTRTESWSARRICSPNGPSSPIRQWLLWIRQAKHWRCPSRKKPA